MNKQKSLLLIVILAVAVCYANISGLDVYALDEAKNAEAAREMFESGDYVVPYYNYQLRTDKPPLHYYFMAAGYSIFGVNEFGAYLVHPFGIAIPYVGARPLFGLLFNMGILFVLRSL